MKRRTLGLRKDRKDVNTTDTHGVCNEVVDEPGEGNSYPFSPVATNDQPVRSRSVSHRVLLVVPRLIHVESPEQDSDGRNGTDTQ